MLLPETLPGVVVAAPSPFSTPGAGTLTGTMTNLER